MIGLVESRMRLMGGEELFPNVIVGTLRWMTVNLAIDDGGGGIVHVNNDSGNDEHFGLLYSWDAALRLANYIGDGWFLPSHDNFIELINETTNSGNVSGALKSVETTDWQQPNNGAANFFEFNWQGTGYYYNGTYGAFLQQGRLWMSNEYDASYSLYARGYYSLDYIYHGYQVRMLKDVCQSVRLCKYV